MSNGFVFLDLETPNRFNNRICSIAVSRTDLHGNVEFERHFLVNPEENFDSRNSNIHGIHRSDVMDAPTFDHLWVSELQSILSDCVVVAHNATFDLNVLGKTLIAYGYDAPKLHHVCTLHSVKRLLPELSCASLADISSHFGISLPQHHNAMYDTQACRELYWKLAERFGHDVLQPQEFVYTHQLETTYCATNRSRLMTDLYGIALGISIDGRILPEEHSILESWMKETQQCAADPVISATHDLLNDILSDNVIDESEREQIINATRPFVTDGHNTAETVRLQQLMGILKGVSADRRINDCEAQNLQVWLREGDPHPTDPTVCLINAELEKVLSDGVLDAEEEAHLLNLFDHLINPADTHPSEVVFAGKKFVLSGNFTFGPKNSVMEAIQQRGGEIAKGVSGKVHYVVVGGEGSTAYAHGKYGSKVKKAMELQDKGNPIQIISESDLELS